MNPLGASARTSGSAALGVGIGALAHARRPQREAWTRRAPMALFLLVLGVIGLSLLLVPRGVELASLRAETGQADRALRMLEAQVDAGDRTRSTRGALARARANHGDLAGGIDLFRKLVDEQPNDVTALQSLADLAQAAHRPGDYLRALEGLQHHASDRVRERELARLYVDVGTPQQQLKALTDLVDRLDAGGVADFLRLARLHTERDEPVLALSVLDHMAARFPLALDASVVAAQMSNLLASRDTAGAVSRGKAWLGKHPETLTRAAPQLSASLSTGGHPELAAQFLEAYVAVPTPHPRLLAAWAQALGDAGRPADALPRLEAAGTEAGDGELLRLRIGLALSAGRIDVAARAARDAGLPQLPPALVTSLAAAALAADRDDVLKVVMRGGEAAIGAQDTVLAARIALRIGYRAAAMRWSEAARTAPEGSPTGLLQLARVFEQLGQPEKALHVLRRVVLPKTDRPALGELARLYVALGHAEEGLSLYANIGSVRLDAPWRESWALLAVAAGHPDVVSQWLRNGAGADASAAFLRDLVSVAMDRKAFPLAAAAGAMLTKVSGHDADRLRLTTALLEAGRAPEAIAHLRLLRLRGSIDTESYRAALLTAWQSGGLAADELRRETLQALASHAAAPTQRDADIALLQSLGAFAELLPTLERLAAADPNRWLGAFTDAAERAGQPAPLVALWLRLGDSESLPAPLRAQIAFRLLDAGQKAAAERVLRALAETVAPDDIAMRRLLFVWGPRPKPNQLDWLEARARSAVGDAKAIWLQLLAERGATTRVIDVVGGTISRTDDGAVIDAYVEAISATGDKPALRAALREAAAQTRSVHALGQLARRAEAVGDPALERQLLESAIAAGSRDPQQQRTLGLLAYRTRDHATAQRWLSAFNMATGGDYETHRAIGEILLHRREFDAARRSFGDALQDLDRSGDDGAVPRVAKASLLHRLGRTSEARRLYEALLAERPNDDDLRADYVSMLLAQGDLGQAHAMLAGRAR